MPVSASGDMLARSSSAMRISSSQSRSSGALVTRPSAARPRRRASVRRRARDRGDLGCVVVEARASRVLPVHHRIGAEVLRRHARARGSARGVVRQAQHVDAVGGERELEQRAGEARAAARSARTACATRRRGARACGAASRSSRARASARACASKRRVDREHRVGVARGLDEPGADVELVGAHRQDRVVELARELQRPPRSAARLRCRRCRRAARGRGRAR